MVALTLASTGDAQALVNRCMIGRLDADYAWYIATEDLDATFDSLEDGCEVWVIRSRDMDAPVMVIGYPPEPLIQMSLFPESEVKS